MCEKLFKLCELQLGAIVSDLEHKVADVNAATSKIMQSLKAHQQHDSAALPDSLGEQLGPEVRNLVMGLQFHDELTQRLQHLQTLLGLLQEQNHKDSGDMEKLLSKLTSIFSSTAEFNQLKKVFPACQVASSTEAIELF